MYPPLHTNASGLGVGGVLSATRAGKEEPVGYYARQLKGVEKMYSATEVEALAVVESIRHFTTYLYGCHFHVITDHRALESLLTSKVLSKRLHRFAMKLQEWDMKITYRPGSSNGNADALSRQEWPELKEDNHTVNTIGRAPGRSGVDECNAQDQKGRALVLRRGMWGYLPHTKEGRPLWILWKLNVN